MRIWRVSFEMECLKEGDRCCEPGRRQMAFAIMEREEIPGMDQAYHFVENHLYYCSTKAEKHFLDTGKHEIHILSIEEYR